VVSSDVVELMRHIHMCIVCLSVYNTFAFV
jgi:hypothetical protein